jgi:hypothetical protein
MPSTTVRNGKEPTVAAGRFQAAIYIFKLDKEKLVAEPKGQVLKKRGIEVRAQPALKWPLRLILNVTPRGIPATSEVLCDFGHVDIMHLSYLLPFVFSKT